MTKKELIESLKWVSDDMSIIVSSKSHNDIFEILSVKDFGDGVVYLEVSEWGKWEMSSRDDFLQAGYTVYRIDLNKSEIKVLDMVLSAATKNDFGSEENNDIINFLSDKFSRYRREIEGENEKWKVFILRDFGIHNVQNIRLKEVIVIGARRKANCLPLK